MAEIKKFTVLSRYLGVKRKDVEYDGESKTKIKRKAKYGQRICRYQSLKKHSCKDEKVEGPGHSKYTKLLVEEIQAIAKSSRKTYHRLKGRYQHDISVVVHRKNSSTIKRKICAMKGTTDPYRALRILTGKKHPKIKLQRLQKIRIWTFG